MTDEIIDIRGSDEGVFRQLIDGIAKKYPQLWKICYPRHYEEPRKCGAFYSPKYVALQMVGVTIKLMEGFVGRSEQYEFLSLSHLAGYGVPTYWIGSDMMQAIQKTIPPGVFDWYTMPMPFPAGALMLPKGSLVHPTEGDVVCVMYARLKAGEVYTSKLIPHKEYCSANGGMTMLAYTYYGNLIHWNIPLDAYGSTLSIPDLDRLYTQYAGNVHSSGFWLAPTKMTPEDDWLGLEVMHLVFGTLFLMTARPELVTNGRLLKRVPAKANKLAKEFWSPNIIGESYKIRREEVSLGGTHASPRFHWVKGSYREQPYGKGLKQRKTIWVEPYTRG